MGNAVHRQCFVRFRFDDVSLSGLATGTARYEAGTGTVMSLTISMIPHRMKSEVLPGLTCPDWIPTYAAESSAMPLFSTATAEFIIPRSNT